VAPQGSVTGVDLSPVMIEVAGHFELPEGCAPIEYLVGAAEDLRMQARSRAGGGQVG
jgi:ubiquinone/menaquinone biosynthesis C-methylase UbiE